MMKNKTKPLGKKVISTYYVIVSVLTILLGIIMATIPSTIKDFIVSGAPELATLEASAIVGAITILGAFFIVFGILGIVIGLSLFKLKSWARYTVIFFSLFGFFMAMLGLVSGQWSNLVGLFINGFIAWYLITNKEVKKVFKGE